MPRSGPRDLLREFNDESIRVGDVQCAVPPRAVGRLGEQRDAAAAKRCGHRIDVLNDEHDLAGWAGRHCMPGQPFRPAPFVQCEPSRPRPELGVSSVGEPMFQPGYVAVELDRCAQIRDIEDHVAQERHRATVPPAWNTPSPRPRRSSAAFAQVRPVTSTRRCARFGYCSGWMRPTSTPRTVRFQAEAWEAARVGGAAKDPGIPPGTLPWTRA
jgi:hypothetical protein